MDQLWESVEEGFPDSPAGLVERRGRKSKSGDQGRRAVQDAASSSSSTKADTLAPSGTALMPDDNMVDVDTVTQPGGFSVTGDIMELDKNGPVSFDMPQAEDMVPGLQLPTLEYINARLEEIFGPQDIPCVPEPVPLTDSCPMASMHTMQDPVTSGCDPVAGSSSSPMTPFQNTNSVGTITNSAAPSAAPLASPFPAGLQSASIRSLEMAFGGLHSSVTEWQPARLLQKGRRQNENLYALLILNQPIENLEMLKLVWGNSFFRIAADGGANRLRDSFKDPNLVSLYKDTGLDVICGDLDSLDPDVRECTERRGTKIVKVEDQDSTDFTKCVDYLRNNPFSTLYPWPDIVCLGGLGGRVDQGLAQLHHLYKEQQDPNYESGRVYLLSTEAITFVLKTGKHRIHVRDEKVPSVLGKHVGIIPLKGPSIITTRGLEWDVTSWLTEFGGQMSTSNHVKDDIVEITTTGDVLFTIDLNFPPEEHDYKEEPPRPSFAYDTASIPAMGDDRIIDRGDDMFFGAEAKVGSF